MRRVSGRNVPVAAPRPQRVRLDDVAGEAGDGFAGPPLALFMDLPMWPGAGEAQDQFRVAARAIPWRTQVVLASPQETGFAVRSQIEVRSVIGALLAPLAPGFEGRFDRAATIEVELFDGELASVSQTLLLNGANTAAVLAANGVWEIVQFGEAEEIAPSVWRLTRLLRGQAGTGDAAAAGAATGSSFVLLDETVRPAGLGGAEIGLAMNWRVAPAGFALNEERFSHFTGAGGTRALMPLAPVHLRARKTASGDVALSWVRRGRIDADNWLATEIPLGEETERYSVEVLFQGAVVRRIDVAEPDWTYMAAEVAADFPLLPILPAEVTFTVRQLSAAIGPGLPATLTLTLD